MQQRRVRLEFDGPVVHHDVLCWLCNARSAVYDMNPNWVFRPCWECQESIGATGRIIWRNRLGWLRRHLVGR